ncbi:helix-turn-helix transcriptional regulator [Xanthomonas oryzae]|uniref:helix-turn-helix transcriptional regulator n=1 Tax=Xanthomonas oryzae TaxID=347 RepID=UPI0031B62D73
MHTFRRAKMHVDTLVELAIQRSLRGSLRGLAEQMGISSGALSQWKLGNKPIPDERIQQLARIAGQDPGPWLLLIHSEQDQGELGREWAKLYKRLGMTAATILCAVGLASNPLIAKAKSAEPKSETRVVCILCSVWFCGFICVPPPTRP